MTAVVTAVVDDSWVMTRVTCSVVMNAQVYKSIIPESDWRSLADVRDDIDDGSAAASPNASAIDCKVSLLDSSSAAALLPDGSQVSCEAAVDCWAQVLAVGGGGEEVVKVGVGEEDEGEMPGAGRWRRPRALAAV